MNAVVSLLDDEHYRTVESLWAGLEARFGVRGVYANPFPHFSYQVLADYDTGMLERLLQGFVRDRKPFRVKTGGLGLFTGGHPVVYIPVVRSPELAALHLALWRELSDAAAGVVPYYHPGRWIPHITLGHGDIRPDHLPGIVSFLNEQDLNWDIRINDLTIIEAVGTQQVLRRRYRFAEGAK